MPFYGAPIPLAARSLTSVLIVEPTLGLDVSQPALDVPLGSTPSSDNYIMREGALEPRPMLSLFSNNPQPMGNVPILGATEVIGVGGDCYPLVSGTSRWAWYASGSWSALSYVSAYGLDDPPSTGNSDYWDLTQVYDADRDENIAVGAHGSHQTLYCWQSNTTVFSSLTGAPRATTVAAFDNCLLAANSRSGTAEFVQRVQWSDRGSASSWTQGLAGYEDLLAMRGDITRLMPQENRILVLGEQETWHGYRVDYPPTLFRFEAIDTGVGCPYPWTATNTPLGTVFLGRAYQVYLVPKGGGPVTPIGQRLHRRIRESIDHPELAWGVYDPFTDTYQLTYPIQGGSGSPQRAAWLHLQSGAWAPQSYDLVGGGLSPTRGAEVQRSSTATTWAQLGTSSVRWADLSLTWAQLAGSSQQRAVLVGSSNGTLYYLNSNATSDNGTAVRAYWQSSALLGDQPARTKTATRLAVDYQATSASSLTVAFSQSQGATFEAGTRVALPLADGVGQVEAHTYVAARYPTFRVESEGFRYRLYRFLVEMRIGGR